MKLDRTHRRSRIVAGVLLLLCNSTFGQTQWLNPVSGSWGVGANWAGGGAPDSAVETAEIAVPGTYTVSFNISPFALGGLLLTNPNATVEIMDARTMPISGSTFTNDGVVVVNAQFSATILRADHPALTLGGSGEVRLQSFSGLALLEASGANVLTNGAAHEIVGDGRITAALVNNGRIAATAAADILRLQTSSLTNHGLIEATGGGRVEVYFVPVLNGPAGVIRSVGAGSEVVYTSSTVTGGTLASTGGGVSTLFGSLTVSDVTLAGPHGILGGTTVTVGGGGIINSGEITLNAAAEASAATVRFSSAAAGIGGTGTIRMNAHPDDHFTASIVPTLFSNVLTLGGGQTLAGSGRITNELINYGVIDADVDGATLELAFYPKTNNNVLRASNGGTLLLSSTEVVNAGVIRAVGSGSVVDCLASSVTGGALGGLSGGSWSLRGNVELGDVTFSGPGLIAESATLHIVESGITNDGEIVVNATAGTVRARLSPGEPVSPILGSGTVRLNASGADIGSAQLYSSEADHVLVLGPGQSLVGRGTIETHCVILGMLDPGASPGAVGRMEQRTGSLTLTAGGGWTVDLNGTSSGQFDAFDAVAGTALSLNGELQVRVGGGFSPERGDEFELMTHASRTGEFGQLVAPPVSGGDAWRLRYEAARTVLALTCEADISGDHVVTLTDLSTVLANFGASGAGGGDGDANGDGNVNLSDLSIVLSSFGGACPT